MNEWNKKSFLIKIFTKNKINKKAKILINDYFVNAKERKERKECYKLFFNGMNIKTFLQNNFDKYLQILFLYKQLDKNDISYLKSLIKVKENLLFSNANANNEIFNFLKYDKIIKFKNNNQNVFSNIDNFENIVKAIHNEMTNKIKLVNENVKNELSQSINNIENSKKFSNMIRIINSKSKKNIKSFIKKFDLELFQSIKIWLLTPEVVSEIMPLEMNIFDLVIFDEASQMYPEKGIPAILRAKKILIAGDSKQLRPSSLGVGRIDSSDNNEDDFDTSAALEEESLLDLAKYKYKNQILKYHYRSKYSELINFSNYAFYNGRLYISPNIQKEKNPPIKIHRVENALWVNNENYEEAKYVVKLLKKFFEERKNNETIGIITFNSKQRELIENEIWKECKEDNEFYSNYLSELSRKENGYNMGIFIKNIETVQGDERDNIIFSIGYAKNIYGKLSVNFGWLNIIGGENRLNVAISRAKRKIDIVLSFDPNELNVENTKNEGPKIFKKYLEYCIAVDAQKDDIAKNILMSLIDDKENSLNEERDNLLFDSSFEEEVYEKLSNALDNNIYKIESQIGVGGYSIDLAIKKDDKYILGIECDGALYHSSKSARNRDLHRQKFLELRGWKIHRIWSSNWWTNSNNEILKIKRIVENL